MMTQKLSLSVALFALLLSLGDDRGSQRPGVSFALSLSTSFTNNRLCMHSQKRTILWAKPPPTSNFDLSSIEAFEAAMDLKDQEENTESTANGAHDGGASASVNDNSIQILSVPDKLKGKRIDAVLSKLMIPELSRSACGNLVADGCVEIVTNDGAEDAVLLNRKAFKVEAGMTLRVTLPKNERPDEIVAQNLPLKILYEDEHMIVINKEAGMVVHPAAGNWDGTVVNALAYYLANESPFGAGDFVGMDGTTGSNENSSDEFDDEVTSLRPGIVHRLDKGTTGVLIVSKTADALAKLSEAFASRKVKKTYLAVTVGNPGKRVRIDKPIGRHPIHRQRMRVVPDPHRKNSSGIAPKDRLRFQSSALSSASQSGRRALSFVDTLQFDGKLSLVQVRIETGRTHQIRVHLQDRHTPIYGDDVYGISDWNKRLLKTHGIGRPLLHAHRLEIDHPITGEPLVFVAPMAADMISIARGIWPDGPNVIPGAYQNRASN